MSRWEPDARVRLERAAIELYSEPGYAETTVAALAQRAGLTERTYFRHFPDKREVLFGNEAALGDAITGAVAAAPDTTGDSVRVLVRAGLGAVATLLQPRHHDLVLRGRIVAQHVDLRERELMKLSSWTQALRDALTDRGVGASESGLGAEVAIAVLNVAAQRWIAGPAEALLVDRLGDAFAELDALLGHPPAG